MRERDRQTSRVFLRTGHTPQRPDCMAGHAGLELRNVDTNYPFESSHRFPEIQPTPATETIRVRAATVGGAARAECQDLGRMLAPAGIAAIFCRCRDDPAAANPRFEQHSHVRRWRSQAPHKFELVIGPKGAETKYPDLDCAVTLTRAGTWKSYVFFVEIITRG
jgi:hypothetical protein